MAAWLAAWENPVSYGKIYNVSAGQKTRVVTLVEALKEAMGAPRHPVEYLEGTPGDQFGVLGDNTLLSRDLGWQARTGLLEGLRQLVEYEERRRHVRFDQ